MSRGTKPTLEAFAVAPPGFTDLVEAELRALGLRRVQSQVGGVGFHATPAELYKVHLHARVTGRVLLRAARFFAPDFRRLEAGLRAVDWPRLVSPESALAVHCSTKKTRLYHTEKLIALVRDAVAGKVSIRGDGKQVDIYLRIKGDKALVSIDASGEHLHKRGYRTHAGVAPLRENLAAGLLLRAAYDGSQVLLDPCCGSGTFPVEAALIAREIAPGLGRTFAFERFPDFNESAWVRLKEEAKALIKPRPLHPVFGADADPDGVALAARAAREAGVGDDVQVAVCDLDELSPGLLDLAPVEAGLLVANPPWGHRLSGAARVYGTINSLLRGPFASWRWGVIVAGGEGARSFRQKPLESYRFSSGGLPLEFRIGGPSGRG